MFILILKKLLNFSRKKNFWVDVLSACSRVVSIIICIDQTGLCVFVRLQLTADHALLLQVIHAWLVMSSDGSRCAFDLLNFIVQYVHDNLRNICLPFPHYLQGIRLVYFHTVADRCTMHTQYAAVILWLIVLSTLPFCASVCVRMRCPWSKPVCMY